MGKKLSLVLTLIIIAMLAIPATAQQGKKAKPPALQIALSQGYSPQPNFTLAGYYSKLKTYLDAEFSTSVTSISNWRSSTIRDYDVIILPGRYQAQPPSADVLDLRDWLRDGGCLIILWHPMDVKVADDRNWPGTILHDNILSPNGLKVKATPAGSKDIRTILSPFDNTPYTADEVSGTGTLRTAWMHEASGGGKFLGWNADGHPVASYNPKVNNKGKLFLIGNVQYFQNSFIDNADNKNFLLNIIHFCSGNGNGGGGDPDPMVKTVKGQPKKIKPGKNVTGKARIKNIGGTQSSQADVYFYLSPDQSFDATDSELGSNTVPALNPNKSKLVKKKAAVPNIGEGNYYVIAYVDKNSLITDADRTNNVKASNNTVKLVGQAADPDLKVTFIKGKPGTVAVGDQMTITVKVKNIGKSQSSQATVHFYFSPDKQYDASDVPLGSGTVQALNKNKRTKITKVVVVPSLGSGEWYIIAYVDKDSLVADANRNNNIKASNGTTTVQ